MFSKKDIQFFLTVLFVVIFNYILFRIFIYLYNKFEYLQMVFSGLLSIVVPICIILSSIIEIALLYESLYKYKKSNSTKYDKNNASVD